MSSSLRVRSSIFGCSLSLIALSVLPDCGARTAIELAESCADEGETRACENACGAGFATCTDGYWGECRVESVARACSGVCGAGIQTCADGLLGPCLIPVATRSCANDCGPGEQTCENEVWHTCVVPLAERDCSSACGSGHETCSQGKWGACDAPLPKPPVLNCIVRDLHKTQTDFETPRAPDRIDAGMVQPLIGADRTPVYAGNPITPSTPGGKAGFDVWYHDTPGVNSTTTKQLTLAADPAQPGSYFYENRSFFLIDDELFGNEGLSHNFHFTVETHFSFVYRGGEVFTFAGDDDVWVFIADQLVIDLGGTHTRRSASVQLDQVRANLGLVVGQKYPLDLFFAERHTLSSTFIVHTTIADVGACQ